MIVSPNDVRAFVFNAIEERPPKEQDILDCLEVALLQAAYEQQFPAKTASIYVGYADVNRQLDKYRDKDKATDEAIRDVIETHYVDKGVWEMSMRKQQPHLHVGKVIGWLFTEPR